jgi:hypothetical protein
VNESHPDPDDRRKHLDLIQAAVTRMASASSNAKSWLLPVVTATYGYALVKNAESVALLGIAAVIVFAMLDAQYLRQERAFRALYRDAVAGNVPLFELSPARYFNKPNGDEEDTRSESCKWRKVIWSWSLGGFYGPLGVVGAAVLAVSLIAG